MLVEKCLQVGDNFSNHLSFIEAGNDDGIFYGHVIFWLNATMVLTGFCVSALDK
jgi:hypothetical protein